MNTLAMEVPPLAFDAIAAPQLAQNLQIITAIVGN